MVTNGGRVFVPPPWVNTVTEAQQRAYQLASGICWDGVFYRKDIAYRAIARENSLTNGNGARFKMIPSSRLPALAVLFLTVTLVSACSRQSIYDTAIDWERSAAGLQADRAPWRAWTSRIFATRKRLMAIPS